MDSILFILLMHWIYLFHQHVLLQRMQQITCASEIKVGLCSVHSHTTLVFFKVEKPGLISETRGSQYVQMIIT